MGCGASKENSDIVPTVLSKPPAEHAKVEVAETVNALSKPVIPSIAAQVGQSVAFEIPLDGLMEVRRPPQNSPVTPSKLSLPKLTMSETDLKAKLSNMEARWKDLAEQQEVRKRKKGDKPKLKSRKEPVSDLAALKIRLQEKEQAAKLNRDREINKLQLKLARQEEHARKVLERKKALGAGSNEELRLSWGGEKGLADALSGSKITLTAGSNSELELKTDSTLTGGNRMGSGRSNATDSTDTTDVVDKQPVESKLSSFSDITVAQTERT
ncbi:hypothetical protein BC833DRAFT_597328 [Globomyces pollinis-pini]|nr:hypothetical protein BC833DRAFT_597328 [Globomyces pollinis-pini]